MADCPVRCIDIRHALIVQRPPLRDLSRGGLKRKE